MTGLAVTSLWYLDRGTALVTLPSLWAAVMTGVFVRAPRPAVAHRLATRYHLKLSAFALIVAAMHAVVGTADVALVAAGAAPAPGYPGWFFAAGVALGVLSLVAVLVAVASFLAPWRFSDPSLVHALAYVGFGVGVAHAVAVGTDLVGLTERLALWSLALVAAALLVTLLYGLGTALRRYVGSATRD
ncbi:MAG: hypothetical protein ABEJ68_10900 [Halobacteriaceae archaeon]